MNNSMYGHPHDEIPYSELEQYYNETEYYENLIADIEERCLVNTFNYCNQCNICQKQ